MTGLLEAREYLKTFYAKYEIYINPCIKFLVAFISIMAINSTIGYMTILKHPALALIVALMCSFMPKNFMIIISAFYVLLHSYSLAMECALVTAAIFAVMFLLYFRFVPKDTMAVLLTPLLFVLKIPYVMPVALGLLGGPVSAISMSCGIVVYYLMKLMVDNVTIFSALDAETGSQKFKLMLDGIMDNKAMFVTLIVFVMVLLLVYTLRRLSIDHAWMIAIITGLTASAVLLLVCEFILELKFSVVAIVLGSIVSFFLCMAIQFMEFNVDYTRTEMVQFEDDEYYYYVKAVPKNTMAAPEKKVKRINKQHKKVSGKPEKRVSTIKTAHGVSRTTVKTVDTKKMKQDRE